MPYDHLEIEVRWQHYWDEHGTLRVTRRSGRPKRYVLDMSPFPSGVGPHVDRPEGYTATDIMVRPWRMRGYDVLHPQEPATDVQSDRLAMPGEAGATSNSDPQGDPYPSFRSQPAALASPGRL